MQSVAKDGAIIRNISLINMLRQLTDTMFRLTLSVLLKGKLLRTLEMKKQASRLLTLRIAALIKIKKTPLDGSSLSPLAEDLEQYELMKAAYLKVGQEFDTLQRLETVPCRWPLARLSIPLQRIVDRLDRVVAGCCWEVLVTRQAPPDSLTSLRRAVSSPRSPAEELAGGPTKQDDQLQSRTVWEECSSHAQQ